jgi:hypothetical protein
MQVDWVPASSFLEQGEESVEGGRWQRRVASGQGGEVIFGPTGEFAAENGFGFGVLRVEPGLEFARFGFDEGNEDGAVAESRRQSADAGECGGGESLEGANGVAGTFAAVSTGAGLVTGVQEAAEFVMQMEVSFGSTLS